MDISAIQGAGEMQSSGPAVSSSTDENGMQDWTQFDSAFTNAMYKHLSDELQQLQEMHKQHQQRDKEIRQGQ